MRRHQLIGLLLSGVMTATFAQQTSGKLSGHLFGDYYLVSQHHNPDIKGMNGFWFRRVYFTYDQKTGERTAIRFRFEMNSPGDFKTADTLDPYVKDAYLQYTSGKTQYLLGLIPPPLGKAWSSCWAIAPSRSPLSTCGAWGIRATAASASRQDSAKPSSILW
jgi:hypothetical protein